MIDYLDVSQDELGYTLKVYGGGTGSYRGEEEDCLVRRGVMGS